MSNVTQAEAEQESRCRVEAARDLLIHVLDGRIDLAVASIGVSELLKQAREFSA